MRYRSTIGLVLLLSACNTWSNQPTVPQTSRTAIVHDVRVGLTAIEPVDLEVNVGDEVRFINDKTQPIRVILIEAGKSIACNKGFNGLIDQQADIKAGQYASFCYSKPGTMKYMARDQTAVTGGEVVLPGQIIVKTNTSKAIGDNYPSVGRSHEGNGTAFSRR